MPASTDTHLGNTRTWIADFADDDFTLGLLTDRRLGDLTGDSLWAQLDSCTMRDLVGTARS